MHLLRPARHFSAQQRGFTLIELVVVVIIITALAVLALPSITERLRDRRVHQAAQEVATIYRNGRMRAMGRGAAILVRYDRTGTPSGSVEIREGVQGEGGDCAPLPEPGCIRSWLTVDAARDDNRLISRFDIGQRSEFPDTHIVMHNAAGAEVDQMDVCFTPLGRAFVRYTAVLNAPFVQLIGVPEARVFRKPGSGPMIGRLRRVPLLPNGSARLSL